MTNSLKEELSKSIAKRRPTEKSVINHNIRDKLGISSDEYCIIDLCSRMYIKNKQYKPSDIVDRIGYNNDIIKSIIKGLIEKRLLEKSENESPKVTDKWCKMFIVDDKDFEEFMEKIEFPNRIVKWTGSKIDARNKYEKARKLFSSIYLLERKKAYFEYLSRNIKRDIMGASVFLNVKTRRFSEPWETYDNPNIKQKPEQKQLLPAVPTISKQDLLSM